MDVPSRHAFEEHTGEVRIVLHAPSHEGIFVEAALALAELMTEDPRVPLDHREEVRVEGRDWEALLVDWLDALIYLTDTTGRVHPKVDSLQVGEGRLVATVRGGEPRSFKTSVKAATFHDLRVEQGVEGVSAAVILDV